MTSGARLAGFGSDACLGKGVAVSALGISDGALGETEFAVGFCSSGSATGGGGGLKYCHKIKTPTDSTMALSKFFWSISWFGPFILPPPGHVHLDEKGDTYKYV